MPPVHTRGPDILCHMTKQIPHNKGRNAKIYKQRQVGRNTDRRNCGRSLACSLERIRIFITKYPELGRRKTEEEEKIHHLKMQTFSGRGEFCEVWDNIVSGDKVSVRILNEFF